MLDTTLIILSSISAYLAFLLYTEIKGGEGDYLLARILRNPSMKGDFSFLMKVSVLVFPLMLLYTVGGYYGAVWNGGMGILSGIIFIGATVVIFTRWVRRII